MVNELRSSLVATLTGFCPQGTKAHRIIAAKGSKTAATLRAASRENMTVLATINALGGLAFYMMIFKGKRLAAHWTTSAPPNARFAVSDSFYMTTELFHKFIVLFCAQLTPGKHLVLLDGHISHITYATVEYAETHDLLMFQLPSHSSHVTQPLDVCGFGSVKRKFTDKLQQFSREHGHGPDKGETAGVVFEALAEGMTPPIIRASFKGAGLYPFDPERAIRRLSGGSNRKRKYKHSSDKIPLILQSTQNTADALGERNVRLHARQGITPTNVRVSTIMMSESLKPAKRSAVNRKRAGIVIGDLLTSAQLLEQEATTTAAKTAAKTAKQAGTGRPRGRPKGTVRGKGTNAARGSGGGPGRTSGGGRGSGAASRQPLKPSNSAKRGVAQKSASSDEESDSESSDGRSTQSRIQTGRVAKNKGKATAASRRKQAASSSESEQSSDSDIEEQRHDRSRTRRSS